MTPTPIKPTSVYVYNPEKDLIKHETNDYYMPPIGWVKKYNDRYVFSKHELEAHDKETLRGFIDKYGERIFEAGCNRTWDGHFGSVTAPSPNCSTFLSYLKAELGLNDNTTEK